MRLWFYSFLLLAPQLAEADQTLVTNLLRQHATPEKFEFCHGGGCAGVQTVRLSPEEWAGVAALFSPAAKNAGHERVRIAKAIAMLEQIVGQKTGTSADVCGTFEGFGMPGQLDCIDESTNTTTYLKLLRSQGLLRFHEVDDTRTRGYFLRGWPHTAASIHESGAQSRVYIVDSWFNANGKPPVILPLPVWQGGWSPKSPQLPADAKVEPSDD